MSYLLTGDDTLALRFRKQELINNFLKEHPEGQILVFDFTDGRTDHLESLEEQFLPSLFAHPKIVVVDGLSNLYDGSKERVENILASSKAEAIVFLEQRKIPKADAFVKSASGKMDAAENFDLKKRNLNSFINILEGDLGGSLDSHTRNLIKERSGKDDELALQSIQKVLTYSQGKKISQKELDALVPAPLETKVFEALDALVSGQKEKAFVTFHRLLTEEDIFRIFPLCAWQIRQMLIVKEVQERLGGNKEGIAKEAGIHPFVVQKLLRVLPNFSRPRLARGLRLLAELDSDLKRSKKTPEGALQQFVFHW